MSSYTKSTNFATKDTLTSGDPLKIVRGTEINTEFDNIQTAVNSKSDTASPTFTGTVTIPTLSVTGASTFGTTITYGGVTLTAAVTGTGKMVLDTSPTLSGTVTASGLTASSAVATDASKGLVSVTNTGTGNNVLATSPTLVTPILGTPQSGTLTNATGLPLTTGVTGVLPEANGGTGSSAGNQMFKNRLINGAMVIDQRNAGASVTPTTNQYSLDRWEFYVTQSSKVSFQQNAGSVTPPAGFKNYLGLTVGASANVTVGSTDLFILDQYIEGYNIADLGFGAAGASTVTLSFWVRSSLTGTFGGSLTNSGNSRSYPFTYTISSANTWEQKTITVAGDTSGTWLSTNGTGLGVRFSIGTGSTYLGTSGSWAGTGYFGATGQTNLITTNSATFYITGVQLEKGSTATSFDYRPYGTELALCQRYLPYFSANGSSSACLGVGQTAATTAALALINFPVQTRVPPTGITISSSTHFSGTTTGGSQTAYTSVTFNAANVLSSEVYGTGATGMGAAGGASQFRMNNTSAYIYFTGCEL